MQSFVNVRALSRICTIIVLFVLVVAVPAAAIASPTIDTMTPSTTSIVNGGDVVITMTGTTGAPISEAWIFIQGLTGGPTSYSFTKMTNGNQWNGQYTYSISPSAQSGQYKITRVVVQDSAGNMGMKDYNVVINVQNSASSQSPTIDSMTPSTTNVVNGGNVVITMTGTTGVPIGEAWIFIQGLTGGPTSYSFTKMTNGNQWNGQYTYSISPSAQSGQYKITRVVVQDSAGNMGMKDYNVVINVQNSGQSTPTSTATQTASPTTIPVLTSLTTSITTAPTISPTTIITTTAVPTTVHTTAITTIPTSIPTTGQPTSLTTAPTPTITSNPTSSVEKLLEEQNKKIDAQNTLIAEQNQKLAEQNDLLTQILNYFKGIFGWK